jgi:DNA replication protein DnaC
MSDTPQVLLAHHLKALRLPTFLREYDKLARQCAAEGVDHSRYLLRLAELEIIERERRTVERRIKEASFPAVKSLDSFDFTAIPSLNKTLVLELARSEYIARRENVIALGNSGTGKTHIALGLGLAACQKGLAVGFTTALARSSSASSRASCICKHEVCARSKDNGVPPRRGHRSGRDVTERSRDGQI